MNILLWAMYGKNTTPKTDNSLYAFYIEKNDNLRLLNSNEFVIDINKPNNEVTFNIEANDYWNKYKSIDKFTELINVGIKFTDLEKYSLLVDIGKGEPTPLFFQDTNPKIIATVGNTNAYDSSDADTILDLTPTITDLNQASISINITLQDKVTYENKTTTLKINFVIQDNIEWITSSKKYPVDVATMDFSKLDIESSNYDNDVAIPVWLEYVNVIKHIKGVDLSTESNILKNDGGGNPNLLTGTKDFTPAEKWINLSRWTEDGTLDGNKVLKTSTSWLSLMQEVSVTQGKTYTFSAKAKTLKSRNLSMFVSHRDGESGVADTTWKREVMVANTWQTVSITFSALKDGIVMPNMQLPSSNTLWISSYKLEEGSEITPDGSLYGQNANFDSTVNFIFNNISKVKDKVRKSIDYHRGYYSFLDANISAYMDKISKSNLTTNLMVWLKSLDTSIDTDYQVYDTNSNYKIHKMLTYDSTTAIGNLLMGYAPYARWGEYGDDITLMYVDVLWSELEPEKGWYDWDSIESTSQFAKWRNAKKHIVFRFILDTPTDVEHVDVPHWLMEELGDSAGSYYDMDYGKGYCPNYENEQFIAYYTKAVEAIKARYGNDHFIAYIQLGALGHWGEWHTNYEAVGVRAMPPTEIRRRYIEPWLTGFPNANIMMRRSWDITKEYNLGIFNDMMGNKNDTDEWLDWMTNGGSGDPDSTGKYDVLVPMPDIWKSQPMGGEFTSSTPMNTMLVTNINDTMDGMTRSHTTFIGQKIADKSVSLEGYNTVLRGIGYRIWIDVVQLEKTDDIVELKLWWNNNGIAPFYRNYDVNLYIVNKDTLVDEQVVPVNINLKDLLPNSKIITSTKLTGFDPDIHKIAVGVIDPMISAPAMKLMIAGRSLSTRPFVL